MSKNTELKQQLIGELKDHKEKERLERVEQNSSLKEVVIYTDKNQPSNESYLNILKPLFLVCILYNNLFILFN